MSNLVAWGDESVRTQGQDVPAYYMGVCICNLEEVDVHRMLTTVCLLYTSDAADE